MALDPNTVGGVIARGGNAAQSQADAPSPLDVWTHTGEGFGQQGATSSMDLSHIGSTPVGDVPGAMKAQAGSFVEALKAVKDADGALATTGAVFGALTSAEQLISIPFSAIPFPALPAVRILDFAIGLPHAHSHPPNLIPPNPVPIPLPSFGPVIPIPFLSGAGTVLINGMPAGRCLDMGLGIWCGGYFPMFEIFLGSSSVWIEGMRAARIGVDITKHCVFSSFKVAPGDPPLGVPIGTTVTASPNVIIGGVPMPSLMAMAVGAAMKGAFKGLGKLAGAVKGARAARAASRADKPPPPGRTPAATPARPPRRALPPAPERRALPAAPPKSWPPRTVEAYEAAQKVRQALDHANDALRKMAEASGERSPKKLKPGCIEVYTHADGSRSVGISGRPGEIAAPLVETYLNRFAVDGAGVANRVDRSVWRVSGKVDPELAARLNRAPGRGLDPTNCAEPRAASAAHRSDSPITGHETIHPGQKVPDGAMARYRLPVQQRWPGVENQMNPCQSCDANRYIINEYAHGYD